jgi:hypothetical protein
MLSSSTSPLAPLRAPPASPGSSHVSPAVPTRRTSQTAAQPRPPQQRRLLAIVSRPPLSSIFSPLDPGPGLERSSPSPSHATSAATWHPIAVWRFLVTLLAALMVASVAYAGTTKPSLRLLSTKPLVVQGRGFHPAEHVRVKLIANDETIRRNATASPAGLFRTDFGTVPLGRCGGFSVRAVGSRGSVAALKRPPLPACMPARSP